MMISKITWFDITEIKDWNGHFTGIQRVVFNLGKELTQDPTLNLRLCRYDRRRKVFIETTYEFKEPEYASVPSKKLTSKVGGYSGKLKGALKSMLPVRIKRVLKKVISFNSRPFISFKRPIDLRRSDTVIVPGAFWIGSLNPLLKLRKRDRPTVFAVMYDMVPVIMPQFCAQVTVIDFEDEIKNAAKVVDEWLSISESTKRDLLEYSNLNKLRIKADKIKVIRLGSDINTKGKSKSPFKATQKPKEFILFVSTIEPRKNQQFVYQAIKYAEEKNISIPPIVLAGKHGWHSDDFVNVLRRDRTIKDKIIWLQDVDDRALRWLYKNCLFTIYPSIYEGWGLPVAESLAYGKFSIVSSASSLPEVAGDLVDYHSPYDIDEFVQKVDEYANNRRILMEKEKRLIESFRQPRWSEAADQVRNLLN